MSVLVDTSIWSLALRRHRPDAAEAKHLLPLLRTGNAALLGVVRQEVLSGIPDQRLFALLRDELRPMPDHPVTPAHHEMAAQVFNQCRARGVQGSMVDYLLCATSIIDDIPIYTADRDFEQYAQHVQLRFYPPR